MPPCLIPASHLDCCLLLRLYHPRLSCLVLFLLSLSWLIVQEFNASSEGMLPSAFIPVNSGYGSHLINLEECAARYLEANYERSLRETTAEERRAAHLRHVGIDHVYIIHHTPLKYRGGNLSVMLQLHNVTGEWVKGFDKKVLNLSTDRCFHYYDPRRYTGAKATRYATVGVLPRPMGAAQRSVAAKHLSALYDAYRHNYTTVLVLEDDVLLRVGFVMRLAEVMRETPPGFEAIFLGGCMGIHAWRKKFRAVRITKHIYRKQGSRCTHAVVLSQTGVRKLLRSLPITEPIDVQMNLAMQEENMTVYWVEPWLAVQGRFGEDTCVTKTDIPNARSCRFSTLRRYTRSFDVRYINEEEVLKRWDKV